MAKWSALALGGIFGTFARYLLAGGVYRTLGTDFPYGTLLVNLSGCLLIGVFDSMAEARFLIGPIGRLFLMTGFCGAFTTFSTLMLETSNLIRDGQAGYALFNFLGSGILGFVLFRLGLFLGALI